MSRTSIASVVALAFVALLVTAPIVGVVSTAAGQSSAGNASEDSEYTLSELKQDGPHQGNAPPSVRMGDSRSFWLVHWPANNPFADVGSVEGGEYLPEDHTLGRNVIHIRTWTYEDLQKTVHVVYWEKGTRTVQQGNTTVEEPVARNVSHVSHDVTFDRGRPTVPIDLRTHDEPVQVTMWIEGYEWARWTFQHKSIATTQSVDINSAGDYLTSVILDFLLWIVVGGFLAGAACKRALDEAHSGPGYGYEPWFLGLTIATGLGSLLFYESLADLVVNAQYVLALYVVGILAIVMLETYTTNVSKALFLRPTLEHAESPTGDDAFDVIDAEAREEKIVRAPDGTVSVITPGLFPFLARVFGKSARLENVEQLRTRVPLGESKWDELFVVDPEADELIHYSQEGWEMEFPPFNREYAPTYGLVGVALAIAVGAVHYGIAGFWPVAAVTAAGLLTWGATPVDGVAGVDPAPVHLRSAFGTMLQFAEDVDDAKRFDEVKEQLDSERVQKQRDVDREVADHDRTLVEEMLDPDAEVPAAVDVDEYADDEVTDHRRTNGNGDLPSGGADDD
ncbi:hypothetical protein [Halomicrobium salinisoli]|uniref:hypothetical protein n=1 Tax=Halomicrobium salinisoli TaxID=2878391 RepID=UPI001CF04DC3|nr:hypothetical protein [Halomicrobium salinisoli]